MEQLLDFCERGEARCEDWAADNVRGDEMTCSCGKTCKLDDAQTISPDPYAIPICPTCFETWWKERSAEQGYDDSNVQ